LLGVTSHLNRRLHHVKEYGQLGKAIHRAVAEYAREVRSGAFPAAEHSFSSVEGGASRTANPVETPNSTASRTPSRTTSRE
jgi:hypothetical protein